MERISRRQCLRGALAATAAAAVTSCAQRASDTTPRTRAVSGANDRVRIAVFGVRGRGLEHIAAWLHLKNVEVAAISDVDWNVVGPAMKAVSAKTGAEPRFQPDFRRILDDKSIDAVSIATPNHWHSLQAILACQAGKDVYVEKPVSHNIFEGRQLVAAAQKYSRIVQVGTQGRSSRAIREGLDFVNSGAIGKLLVARGLCYKRRQSIGHTPDEPVAPIGVDYNMWLGPAPVRPFNRNRFHYEWHWNWDYGNGDIGNRGVHQMDICLWGIRRNHLPGTVMSMGGRFGYSDDGQTPNTQIAAFDYGDVQVIFEVRGLPTEPYMGASIGNIFHCTDGHLVIAGDDVAAFSAKGEKIRQFKGEVDHFRNFVDAVRSRSASDLNAPILNGHMSSAMCHLANISYRLGASQPMASEPTASDAVVETFQRMREHLRQNRIAVERAAVRKGKVLSFDPNTERFISDENANAMLTRDYRGPFIVPQQV